MDLSHFDFHGNDGIITKSYGTLSTDRTQLCSCTAEFMIKKDKWASLPDIGSRHPVFSFIEMEHRDLAFEGLYATATCKYAGIQSSGEFGTPPVYELCVGVSEEPIETHFRFAYFAGTPSRPLNGANFRNVTDHSIANAKHPAKTNAGYVFDSFDIFIGSDKNKLAGIQSYLDSSAMTFRKTFNVPAFITTLNKVGSISIPDGPAPSLGGNRNWLDMGLTQTKRGSCYQLVQEWRASGRNGWNKDIYP